MRKVFPFQAIGIGDELMWQLMGNQGDQWRQGRMGLNIQIDFQVIFKYCNDVINSNPLNILKMNHCYISFLGCC